MFLMKRVLISVLLIMHLLSSGQGVDLDLSFGNNGLTVFQVLPAGYRNMTVVDIDTLHGGGFISVGHMQKTAGPNSNLFLLKLDNNGIIDSSYGVDGFVIIDDTLSQFPKSLTVLPNDNIVVSGIAEVSLNSIPWSLVLWKFDSLGNLVQGFGVNGMVINNDFYRQDPVQIRIDGNDKIVVTGGFDTDKQAFCKRFNADGSLDSSFATNGTYTYWYGTIGYDYFVDVELMPDGKLLLAGVHNQGGYLQYDKILLHRLNTDGTLDTTFANGALFAGYGALKPKTYDIAVANDGTIYATGRGNYHPTYYVPFVCKILPDGSLVDTTWNRNGYTYFPPYRDSYGKKIALNPDNSIVVGVEFDCSNGAALRTRAAIFMLKPDGYIDSLYGQNGFDSIAFTISPINTFDLTSVTAMFLQTDNKIVLAGNEDIGKCMGFARFKNEKGLNDAPVAINDTSSTTNLNHVAIDVLNNDSDLDGPSITITEILNPNNGIATIDTNGNIAFIPDSGFVGTASFDYVICDNGNPNLCDTATVYIDVLLVVPTANFKFDSDSCLTINATNMSLNYGGSVIWDFGDGNYATGDNITHVYDSAGTYSVCLTALYLSEADTICLSTTVDTCSPSGYSSINLFLPNIYPNPASNVLTVFWPNRFTGQVHMFNQLGVLEQQYVIDDKQEYTISLEGLPAGIYYLSVNGIGQPVSYSRFVKQ